jgi:hypothetical protein
MLAICRGVNYSENLRTLHQKNKKKSLEKSKNLTKSQNPKKLHEILGKSPIKSSKLLQY